MTKDFFEQAERRDEALVRGGFSLIKIYKQDRSRQIWRWDEESTTFH